ncbi:MAG: cytidylate kinase-like family protein [Clostridia bacterium]
MKNFVITIARGFGSGGKELAMELASQLNINCYENRILVLASQITNRETAELLEIDEKLKGGLINKLKRLPKSSEPANPKSVEKKFESDAEIFECQCDIIRDLASKESCIIVGKCADYVLRDFDNVVSFYVEAPRKYCLKRVTTTMNVDELEAGNLISKTDSFRAEYYKYYTNGNYWTNPVNYDMTFNMERVGKDKVKEIIKNYLIIKFGEEILQDAKNSPTLYSYATNTKEDNK